MVYGFVQRSGAHIKIYSEPGKGSTFRLYFPRVIDEIDDPGEANAEAGNKLPGGNESVLVVDDEEGLLEIAVSCLEDLGYRTLRATNGKQGLELLQNNSIDLLFSDVVMPDGMDGYQLAEAGLKSRPDLRVLLASGLPPGSKSDVGGVDSLAMAKLNSRMLSKPYTQSELAVAARRALDDED